jgi:hypothetical protein
MPDTSTEVAIATTTLGSAASSITFSSIPGTYTDLRLVFVGRGDTGTGSDYECTVTVNGNSSGYSYTRLYGNGTSAASDRVTSNFRWQDLYVTGSSTAAGTFGMITLDLFSYAGSTFKTVLGTVSEDRNGAGQTSRLAMLWSNTAAITSIVIDSVSATNFAAGTTATLYGIL